MEVISKPVWYLNYKSNIQEHLVVKILCKPISKLLLSTHRFGKKRDIYIEREREKEMIWNLSTQLYL